MAGWSDHVLARQTRAERPPAELIYLPSARVLSALSLGYRDALADALWFRTISYFGKHYRGDRLYPWLASMCSVVTDLDPSAEYVYRFGGVLLPWEAGEADAGIALLEKGTRHLPESWRLRYMLGFSYYFFKNDLPAASHSLRIAAQLPGAPAFVARLAAVIDAKAQGPDNAIRFLSEIARSSKDPEIRAALHDRVLALILSRDIDTLQGAVATFAKRFGHMPEVLPELVTAGILPKLPVEPFGGHYVLDPHTGVVRSSTGHKPWRLGQSKIHEQYLQDRR